ncbi:12660_t:CDS:1 [Funneliformis caledonium]|uniref:12660_t:CDS:1 n=2 Tax=Funneliformis TaxID=1117308 RepID=A0A9N8YNW8_9GLOM|nr:12660_t:CDS:1 [Funneliformis caledonium]
MTQKNSNSSVHYYEDGDILVTVQDVTFRIHKNILSIASKVFRDMFTCAISSKEDIPSIILTDTSSTIFENLLSYLYPHKFIPITWENIIEFCHLADKYEFVMVIEAADNFLKAHFQEKPLISLVMADRYRFKYIYKETSKLILDNLLEYKKEQDFKKLSSDTRCALMEKYLDFVLAVSSFQDLKHQYDYQHACEKNPHLYTVCLNKQKTTQLYEEFFNGMQLDPTKSPSINLNLFLEYCRRFKKKNEQLNQCSIYFIQNYLISKIVKYLFSGDIKAVDTLECEKDKENARYYLFIELKD